MVQPVQAFRTAFAFAAVLSAFAVPAQSPDPALGYPNRPVRIVVPFGPGSGPDIRARMIGHKLTERWGQPVIVENRVGAGGQLAMEQVARAAPDGYTLALAGQTTLAIAPHLVKQPFDPLKDFIPVTRAGHGFIVLVVNAELPVKTAAGLVEYARRNPGKLNAASWGMTTITHLALELFTRASDTRITHVPYKSGAAQAVSALVTGEVQVGFEFLFSIAPQLKSGRLRALAVSGRERLRALPEVPTFTEVGLHEMETVSGWQGIAVPAGTPRPIVERIHGAMAGVLALPDIRASYIDAGFDPGGDTPEEFAAFVRAEHARWGKLIAEAGIRAE